MNHYFPTPLQISGRYNRSSYNRSFTDEAHLNQYKLSPANVKEWLNVMNLEMHKTQQRKDFGILEGRP